MRTPVQGEGCVVQIEKQSGEWRGFLCYTLTVAALSNTVTIFCFHVLQFMVRAAAKLLSEEPEMLYQMHLTMLQLVDGVTVLWGTIGHQEQRSWLLLFWVRFSGMLSRPWQTLFLLKMSTRDINWVFWAFTVSGVLLKKDRDLWVCHKYGHPHWGRPTAGAIKCPPAPSMAPWYIWGCLEFKRI